MNSNKLIAFMLTLVVFICSLVSPALAADYVTDKWGNIRDEGYEEPESIFDETIKFQTRDENGNLETLLEFDGDALEAMQISTYSVSLVPDLCPSPFDVSRMVPGLDEIAATMEPGASCNFLFIDFGPNWQDGFDPTSTIQINGRYLYFFCGRYKTSWDEVKHNGVYTFPNAYSWDTSATNFYENILYVDGPYAMVSYSPDTNNIKLVANTYHMNNDEIDVWITGIVTNTDTNHLDHYPRVMTFGSRSTDRFGYDYDGMSAYLWSQWHEWLWMDSWNGDYESPDEITNWTIWDYITNGKFSASDDPLIQLFKNVLLGLADAVNFVKNLPDLFTGLVDFFPPAMAEFLLVSLGVIVTFLLIKFALHVLR